MCPPRMREHYYFGNDSLRWIRLLSRPKKQASVLSAGALCVICLDMKLLSDWPKYTINHLAAVYLPSDICWMLWADKLAYRNQRDRFRTKIKMTKLQYFCIFMHIWWLLKCLVFFCGKFTKPCRHSRTFQLISRQSLASIINKNPNLVTKWPPVATTIPSSTQHHH